MSIKCFLKKRKMETCFNEYSFLLLIVIYFLSSNTILATVNNQSDENFSTNTSSYNLSKTFRTKRTANQDNDVNLVHFSSISSNLGNKFSSLLSEEDAENKNNTKDVLLKLLRFVKDNSIMDYHSVSIIFNTENCNTRLICEGLIYFLTSSDIDVPFHIILVNKELTYLDIYEKLNRLIKGNRKTLIIVDNFIQTKVMEYLFSAVDKSILDAHFWLFLQRLNETSPNGFETVEQLLEKKLDLSSNIFTFTGDSERGILSEIYKKCPSEPTTTSPIATIQNTRSETNVVEFIWNRRQDLTWCPLKVAYLHDPPFVYETDTNETTKKSKDCLSKNGLTICGSYLQLFRIMVEQLNFNVIWVNAEDNKYGSFDEEKGRWNGVTGLLSRNEADVSLLHMSVTTSRSKVITYSIPITETEARMYIRNPTYKGSWVTYLEVFDSMVWFALLLMSVVVSFSGCIIFINKEEKPTDSKYLQNFGSSFSFFWGAFSFSQDNGVVEKITTTTGKSVKLFIFIVSVFGMTIFYHYEGKLISYVISRETILPINNLEDILRY